MSRKRRKRGSKRRRRSPMPAAPRRRASMPHLVTPEGDAVVFMTAHYQHANMNAIRQVLSQAADFDLGDDPESGADEALRVMWYETDPGARRPPPPLGRRVLAALTLTPMTLEVEAMSEERLENCQRRLEALVGDHIHLLHTHRKSVEQMLREKPPDSPPEPVILPPETRAEIEEQMLLEWLDASVPALDGLTPREAVKTPEGRQRVLDLLDYIERMQQRRPKGPNILSPDYREAKKRLGLE